jgi:preprotein translocase subunit SecE
VARNRKRAKERRARQPGAAPGSRPGVATARTERPEAPTSLTEPQTPGQEEGLVEAPSPLEHAAPDGELANAQIALGRAEAGEDVEEDLDEDEFEDEEDVANGATASRPSRRSASVRSSGELEPRASSSAEAHAVPGNRLVNFLQGSWRELQRVQWPDRRQVMQATGVVIGFVIVAGLYLGLADTVASRIVNLILK